jgi:hypothetical protein
MANTRTLTSANAILYIAVASLFPTAQRIQGFSADNITESDSTTPTQTSMGIDGRLSGGFIPVPVMQNIELQADSLSNDLFEQWIEAEKSVREAYVASGTLIIAATQRRYTMTRGFLTGIPQMPSLGNIIKPRRYGITWESVSPAPYL